MKNHFFGGATKVNKLNCQESLLSGWDGFRRPTRAVFGRLKDGTSAPRPRAEESPSSGVAYTLDPL